MTKKLSALALLVGIGGVSTAFVMTGQAATAQVQNAAQIIVPEAAQPQAGFADLVEARDYFAGKSLFRRFDPECLDAYVSHGLQPGEQGLRLKFDPATEISIYRSVPHTSPGLPQQLAVPLAMVRGRHSRVVLPHHARLLRRMPRAEYHNLPGGHMFPLERPQATADLLRQLFTRWAGSQEQRA